MQDVNAKNWVGDQWECWKSEIGEGERVKKTLKVVCIDDWTLIILQQVDIDELTDLSLEYDVQAVPVLAIMKNGKIVNRIVGLQDTDKLRKWVTDNIK